MHRTRGGERTNAGSAAFTSRGRTLLALGSAGAMLALTPRALPARLITVPSPSGPPAGVLAATSCGAGTLPDGDACVRLPPADHDPAVTPASAASALNPAARWARYEHIPRRPDRPAAYEGYSYPVDLTDAADAASGSTTPTAVRASGHGGVEVLRPKGTSVRLVALENQRGDAQVVQVGPLFGTTVITRHAVEEAGQLREVLLIFGRLDATAAGVVAGARLKEGAPIGLLAGGGAGDGDGGRFHLETRQVQSSVDVMNMPPSRLLAPDVSVATDPRNVLRLR